MKTTTIAPAGHYASNMKIPGMPQIMFAPETGSGSGGAVDADAQAAAAAEAAVAKHAEETAAAEKAAAEAAEVQAAKELQDAEDAAAAAADAGKEAAALAVEKAKLLREVMEKKNKLKEATAALEAYGGVDPAKVRELLKKEQDAELAAAEAKGDFDRVKQMMADEHAKGVKALEERNAALEALVADKDKVIDGLTIGNDFGTSKFISESLTLTPSKARQLYGTYFGVENGRTVAYDKPSGESNRTKMVDASGNPLVFDEAFKRIIEADPDKETLLKAKINPGSASSTTQTKTPEKKVSGVGFGVNRIRASLG